MGRDSRVLRDWRVHWEVDIFDAKSPMVAAKRARLMQLNPRSTATVYRVGCQQQSVEVDLDNDINAPWGSGIALDEVAQRLTRDLSRAEIAELISHLAALLASEEDIDD